MATVSEIVAIALSDHIDHVFGVMGNGNAYFLDALHRKTAVRYWPVRHEAGAVVAADAHFRASGRLAAATATYGAGFTNTLTALAEAVQAQVPLVLVVGDEPTSGPRAWDVDQIALAAAVGARTYTVGHSDAAATAEIALEHALTYRVPTVLAIPYDVARADAAPPERSDEVPPLLRRAEIDAFTDAALHRAVRDLTAARRPLILAGRGAWLSGASAELGELADLLGAITVTSALARGIFPRSEYDLGVAGGFGAEGAMSLVREADVVLVAGASLNQWTMRFDTLFAPGTQVIQIDTAPSASHAHVGTFLRGDARAMLSQIADRLRSAGTASSQWRDTVEIASLRTYDTGRPLAEDGRLDPRAAAQRIGELLPEDRVVVSDGGHFIGWANMYWPVAAPDRMIMVGTAYQSIGLGFPSVPGAAAAKPDSTIVLTTGDGGGLMALADLETAVRAASGRGIAVVWNDGAYGAEVNVYGALGLVKEPMLIPEVDFAALASAVGAEGAIIRSLDDLERLQTWTCTAEKDRRFLLLDLRISPSVVAPYQQEILQRAR